MPVFCKEGFKIIVSFESFQYLSEQACRIKPVECEEVIVTVAL